jgi:putative transposase
MKKSIISETQIVKAIKEYEGGRELGDLCRELGIHKSTFYNWRKKYSGMESQDITRLKELEEENRKLKHMYAACHPGTTDTGTQHKRTRQAGMYPGRQWP